MVSILIYEFKNDYLSLVTSNFDTSFKNGCEIGLSIVKLSVYLFILL